MREGVRFISERGVSRLNIFVPPWNNVNWIDDVYVVVGKRYNCSDAQSAFNNFLLPTSKVE